MSHGERPNAITGSRAAKLSQRLALPLGAVLIGGLALQHYFPASGFFINVAAAPISILLTVLFVDRVVREASEAPWRGADIRIGGRLREVATGAVSGTREILGVRLPGGAGFAPGLTRLDLLQLAAIDHATAALTPDLGVRLEALEGATWRSLHDHLRRVREDAERTLILFGQRLTPDQFESLLTIADSAGLAVSMSAVRSDLYQPASKLVGEDAEWLAARRNWIAGAAQDIRSIISACRVLAASTIGNEK